tara:strand:+ start:43 stop:489 length:447 start_codon:yes stop_codon:yes gene_type:complete
MKSKQEINKKYYESDKGKKTERKKWWKRRGVVFDNDFEEIYDRYINSSQCELCNKVYKNSQDKCLDHCHTTGKFRNVVCRPCNVIRDVKIRVDNKLKEKNINYVKKYNRYRIRIERNKKTILSTSRTTLEDAIKCRDEFIKNNPQHFV